MTKRAAKNTPPHGTRRPTRFRETELARAVRAARAHGGERVEVDPTTGKITVVIGKLTGESVVNSEDTEVENWLSKHKGQHESRT